MKKFITCLLFIVFILGTFSIFNVNYATGETPTVTPVQWYGTGNTYIGVKFNLENVNKEVNYEYAILAANSTPSDSDWKAVYFNNDSTTSTYVTYAISGHEEIFKTQDHIYFSLRTVTYQSSGKQYSTVINKQKCILPLPDFLAERISLSGIISTVSFKPIFGIKKGQYQFVKITDANVIEKYKAYNNEKNEANLSALKALLPSESSVPTSGWNDFVVGESYKIPDEIGYYFVWMKAHEENTITLTGINIIEVTNKLDPTNNSGSSSNSSNSGTGASTTTPKVNPDETVAKTILPKTGKSAIIVFAIIGMIILAFILNKRYKTIDK